MPSPGEWKWVASKTGFLVISHLPAEQLHKILEAILPEEVKGALGRGLGCAQVDKQENENADGEKWNEQIPASCQDVVPLCLV